MITHYHVRNFKQLRNLEADFGRMNVIIGPNSAGKSTLLQSIDFLKAFMESSVDYYLQKRYVDMDNVYNKTHRNAIAWDIIVELPLNTGERGRFEYSVRFSTRKRVTKESLLVRNSDGIEVCKFGRGVTGYNVTINTDNGVFREKGTLLNPLSGFLANITKDLGDNYAEFLKFKKFILGIQTYLIWDPAILRQRSRDEHKETPSELGPNGQQLAMALYDMKQKNPDQFTKMIRKLGKLLPIEDISFQGKRGGWKEIILHERDQNGVVQYNSHQISDGTLRLLAIAYLRYGNRSRSIISFEEPENGVHPPILRASVQMIKEITQLKPHLRSQVFMTTHSPYVLDMFKDHPESIFLMEKGNAETGARLFQLTEDQLGLAQGLFNHSLGNMWFSDFLLGGNEA